MQEALGFLKDAIIEEPQNANVWVWIAAIIEDIDKQEIFLKKALEIDPNNKPAQRGMSFVRKKKSGERSTEGEHLSDYTKPITPFPDSGKTELEDEKTQRATQEPTRQAELNLEDLNDLAGQPKPDRRPGRRSRFKNANLPRLSLIEIVLLSVVVVVFCFIGVLAADMAFGSGGETSGSRGALREIASGSFGQILIGLMALGLAGYVIAVKRVSILLTVLAGGLLFREEHLAVRLAAAGVILAGLVLLALG